MNAAVTDPLPANYHWLGAGNEMFPAMLAAIDAARESVLFEVYIFQDCVLGRRFREAFVRAAERGARVRVLVDAIGSLELPRAFWTPLRSAGGEVREFNPLALRRFWIRDHRKLLVCDDHVAFIGGFNVAAEYEGDGINCGWCDLGMRIEGPLAAQFARSFAEMFALAEFRHKLLFPLAEPAAGKAIALPREQILFSGPGRGQNPFKRALRRDLREANDVAMIVAYFLPARRLRRALLRVARRGGRVRLILAGKSDVLLSVIARQSLYRRFLNGHVEIYEYQPQILHAKMIIVDDVVYVGSSNLDPRSLRINYELMVRLQDGEQAQQARRLFEGHLQRCRRISAEEWRSRGFWQRLKQRWAYFLLNRLDPYFGQRQWRALPD